jgi:hypothetical protein
MSDNTPPKSTETKPLYGFLIIISGFAVVLAIFLVSLKQWTDVKDVTTAVGAVTGTVGSLAGAFFGVHAGAAGKEKAEQQRDAVQNKVERLAALMEPALAAKAMDIR